MQCVVPFCEKISKITPSQTAVITFYRFPSEEGLRAEWLKALGTQDTRLSDSAVVCSRHFLNEDIYVTESGVREICPEAIPSTVLVCMACLDTDSELLLLSKHKLQEAYEQLTGHPCDVGNLQQTLCVQCAQTVRDFSHFREQSLRARSLMMHLLQTHGLITMRHLELIKREGELKRESVTSPLQADDCDSHMEHDADNQTALDEDDNAEVKTEQDSPLVEEEIVAFVAGDSLLDPLKCEDDDDSLVGLPSRRAAYNENKARATEKVDTTQRRERARATEEVDATQRRERARATEEVDATQRRELARATEEVDATQRRELARAAEEVDATQRRERVPATEEVDATQRRERVPATEEVDATQRRQRVPATEEVDKTQRRQRARATEEVDTTRRRERARATDSGALHNRPSDSDDDTRTDIRHCVVVLYDIFKHATFVSKQNESLMQTRQTDSSSDSLNTDTACKDAQYRAASESKFAATHDEPTASALSDTQLSAFGNTSRTQTQKTLYTCDVCQLMFTRKRTFVGHVKTHSKANACKICSYKSVKTSELTVHMRTHTDGKLFKCELCGYKCAGYGHFVRHMRTHTGEKPFSCKLCKYKCAQRSALPKHMRSHTGEKPYSCELCEHKFATNSNLTSHMRTHTGEKPFLCKLCGYKCALSSNLTTHLRTHTGEKPFTCKLCEYKCAQRSALARHMRTHTGEKPFTCKLCKYKCANSSSLSRHMRTHIGEKSYSIVVKI